MFFVHRNSTDGTLGYLEPTSSVSGIILHDTIGACVPIDTSIEDGFSTYWLGFTSIENYVANDIAHPRQEASSQHG